MINTPMSKLDKAFARCLEIAKEEHKGGKKTLDKKAIKLLEESGEFAAAYLMHVGSKGTKKSAEAVRDNLLEEGIDIMLVISSILMRFDFSIDEIAEMFEKKMDKWEKQVKK